MSEGNAEQLVRRAHQAFERGDLAEAASILSPEVRVRQAASLPEAGSGYEGLAGMAQAFEAWTGPFNDMRIEAKEFISTDHNQVVVGVHASGRGGTSGVGVEDRFWFLYSVAEGQVVELVIFGSRAEALEAAGVLE